MDAHTSNISARTPLPLPDSARVVIDVLEDAGFEAWLVGGFVRDSLMGRPVHDVDIATNAHWEEVRDVAEAQHLHTFETGTKHGTISVQAEGDIIEVTTYRSDGDYADARHPDHVTFVKTIDEDLARRDFTMNAIAYHPLRGIFDPYGGCADIAACTIRAVGDAPTRFGEDALRILRAVRFASELGFTIEPVTLAGAHAQVAQLQLVAAERVRVELERMLLGKNVRRALLDYADIIVEVLPELDAMRGFDQKSPYHIYDIYEHTAYVVEGTPATPLLRWAALLHDVGKPSTFTIGPNGQGHFFGHAPVGAPIAQSILSRLRAPSRLTADVVSLVHFHDTHIPAQPRSVKRLLNKLAGRSELFFSLCELQVADARAHAPEYQERGKLAEQVALCLKDILAAGEAFSLRDLAITGADVIALGVEPGPSVGHLLDAALEAVIDEDVVNEHEVLIAFLKREIATLAE